MKKKKRSGVWILFLPVVACTVSAAIVSHQYVRRHRLESELETKSIELRRLARLLPSKYKVRRSTAHQHRPVDSHSH